MPSPSLDIAVEYVLYGLGALIALIVLAIIVVCILASKLPDSMVVERSADFNATPQKVFETIQDFRHWPSWSPWEYLDPKMTKTLSGSEKGVGAIYEWIGNKKVGQGRMEILETKPNAFVKIQLDFIQPFKSNNTTTFTLVPSGATTKMTWMMEGPSPFLMKIFRVLMRIDRAIAGDFDRGLANLKKVVES
jgi:uncharacterized protein YndB with AHSA1/START domain